MSNSNGNTGKIVGSLVVGALAGAALGFLFAPRKGTKTRSKIASGAEKIAKDLTKKMTKETKILKNKASELEGLVEEKFGNVTASLKEKANDMLHTNTDHLSK